MLKETICKTAVFKGINLTENEIKRYFTLKTVNKNEVFYSGKNNSLYILLSGCGAAKSQDGIVLNRFFAGDTVGVASLFGGECPITEIVALAKTEVAAVTESDLKEIFSIYPAAALNYITFLTNKIRFLNSKVHIYTGKDVLSRVYCYLENCPDLNNINMSAAAKNLNIGRTSLYRAINELENNGLIIKHPKGIELL